MGTHRVETHVRGDVYSGQRLQRREPARCAPEHPYGENLWGGWRYLLHRVQRGGPRDCGEVVTTSAT